ncbi:transmembrane alpha-helix domain-containing protein [Purpureocillium lavendulum]|uniref:Transmembrane alpha-helix domain-containing protein n=1 Tax=Purpureocillium lavendulum TaxID=1247861 RepID=A0AB34FN84_9HYPO|nr:transmembrane alpha-helix domain-containing protein [Purpureocillium lavendulum]
MLHDINSPDANAKFPQGLDLSDRALSAGTAGSGIGAGGFAAKNSGGDSQSTKFIIGFCVAIPCTLIIVGLYVFFKRRRSKRNRQGADRQETGNGSHGGARSNGKPRTTMPNANQRSKWGQKRNSKKGMSSFLKLPERLKPATPPAAYRREKELLPSGPP